MAVYYNEIDPYAAQWLKNLIAAGHIAPGEVDTRSIEDIVPEDLYGFSQCHFFAGIGVWSYALRRAGWPDDQPVWTGSCPCQPFSSAGKGAGFADERHLWPAFHHLIQSCQPPVVFGEQVASKYGRAWLALVQADLEGVGYSFGATDLCAAGVGAPHIRQRLYWVADPQATERRRAAGAHDFGRGPEETGGPSAACGLAHGHHEGLEIGGLEPSWAERAALERSGEVGQLADTEYPERGQVGVHRKDGRNGQDGGREETHGQPGACGEVRGPNQDHPLWAACDWIYCRDGKWRPVEPGTFPLAHGAPSRVGRLRAYGNAIVPQVAEAFIRSYVEAVVLEGMLR